VIELLQRGSAGNGEIAGKLPKALPDGAYPMTLAEAHRHFRLSAKVTPLASISTAAIRLEVTVP
jgi:hypothetical protein